MADQATALRRIVENLKQQRTEKSDHKARLICVTGGKGGVGKTNIAINIAISLVQKGMRVLLVDADFGLSNVDIMTGMSPPFDLSHVLSGEKTIREVVAEGVGGISIVSGGSGLRSLIYMTDLQLTEILRSFSELEDIADIIILDTGAGAGALIQRMIEASQEALIVTTPEPTAIMDAYALIKTVIGRHADTLLRLVVNRAESVAEGEATALKLQTVIKMHLRREIVPLGYVLNDNAVKKGVRQQSPFILASPRAAASRNIDTIAWKLLDAEPEVISGLKSFLQKWIRK